MMSSVRQRPNHYEMLGITPGASDADIAEAFARKMNAFRWHPAGAAAGVWIAYETLRDRIRRADYDRALGLAPKPKREWTMAVTREQWTPFVAPVAVTWPEEFPREPERRPKLPPEPTVDPRLESIAATLRELSRTAGVGKAPDPLPKPPEQRRADHAIEPLIEHVMAAARTEKASLRAAEVGAPDWRKPVLIVGGLLLSAGLIGAFAGLSASENQQQTQAETAKNSARPTVKRRAAVSPAATVSAPVASGLDLNAPRPTRSAMAHPKLRRIASRDEVVERAASVAPSQATDSAASDQPAADPLAPQPVAANLPLPNKVIARTIERIGYSCGDIASSAAVDGSPGTFTVTCSSGQSFQATRVHGRYHFRRSR